LRIVLCLLPSLRRDYVDERRDVLATDAAEQQQQKTARLAVRDRKKANDQEKRKACSALEEKKKCDKK
jgi:hypothetical protein